MTCCCRIRDELRLAKRFKHARIFVEENVFGSTALLQETLMKLVENPLAKLPADAYTLSVVIDEHADESSASRDEDDDLPAAEEERSKAEMIIRTDEDLKAAYAATQRSRQPKTPAALAPAAKSTSFTQLTAKGKPSYVAMPRGRRSR